MNRVYNDKLSARVNEQLNRRARQVKMQRRTIAIVAILLVSILIILGSNMRTFASNDGRPTNKYYTSVQVQKGETLWTIADEYIGSYAIDKSEYVKEICQLNHINGEEIHAGDYIVVCYYSKDLK